MVIFHAFLSIEQIKDGFPFSAKCCKLDYFSAISLFCSKKRPQNVEINPTFFVYQLHGTKESKFNQVKCHRNDKRMLCILNYPCFAGIFESCVLT